MKFITYKSTVPDWLTISDSGHWTRNSATIMQLSTFILCAELMRRIAIVSSPI